MPRAKQPVSIDGIEFDALIKSEITYEADVPQYPVESGFTISDTVIVKQTQIDMNLYLTDTPVTWRRRLGGQGRSAQTLKQLENLFVERRLIVVSTSEATYKNMAIQTYSVSKSAEEGYSYEIPITLVQVNVTQSSTTTIPDSYGKSGATGTVVGDGEVVESTEEKPKKMISTLKRGKDAAVNFYEEYFVA